MRLKHNTRNDDTVSRYGGDEFLYMLTHLREQKDIAMIAAKILEAIQAPCHVRMSDGIVDLCLEASIGISVFPKDGDSVAALLKRADDAMYRAKENKSGVAFAQDEGRTVGLFAGGKTTDRARNIAQPCSSTNF
jgi:diguanylate cyclase